jgi:hypothetical protein
MCRTDNKQDTDSLQLVDSDSKLHLAKEIVSKVFGSASIHNFEVSKQGSHFRITVPSEYHVPTICLKQLESYGYSVLLLHGGEQGLEIEIGENKI